jgi:glyceraldehyde-3-phosphate dehydrogenase (NADP+)
MKMLINGKFVDALDNRVIEVYNPATHQKIDKVPRAGNGDIEKAVEFALEGYKVNRKIPAHERTAYLHQTANLIKVNLDELRDLMIAENGKSFRWASFEINKTAEIFETVADRIKDPQGKTYPMDAMSGCETQMAMMYRQSIGVVGGIIPFNFPAEMLAYKAAAALVAGNSIVLKLSEDCPLTCLRIGELMLEAGIPPEVFHMLPGYGDEAGEALVAHPKVPVITFTGSSAVGKRIMATAAPYLKKLSLELGGNDPVIIFEDADIDAAAFNLIRGRMTVGNGQACVADKRFLVQESVKDQFIEMGTKYLSGLKMGNPADNTVDVGPVIHEEAAKRIEEQINDAISKGSKLACGGKRVNKTFIEPTILSDVPLDAKVFTEECFGPVAPVATFNTEEEAVRIANNTPYGLQGAVYSKDISRAMRVADELEVGGVIINDSSCFRPGNVPYMPRKESGLGTDNMFDCLDEMTTGKAVVISGVKK